MVEIELGERVHVNPEGDMRYAFSREPGWTDGVVDAIYPDEWGAVVVVTLDKWCWHRNAYGDATGFMANRILVRDTNIRSLTHPPPRFQAFRDLWRIPGRLGPVRVGAHDVVMFTV